MVVLGLLGSSHEAAQEVRRQSINEAGLGESERREFVCRTSERDPFGGWGSVTL